MDGWMDGWMDLDGIDNRLIEFKKCIYKKI
jgi:hypothetical protein